MAKTERYTNLDVDLERLATRIETYLQENKFEVAFSKDSSEPASWFFIQARKAGALRTAAGARRSTDITIRGEPNNFEVSVGTGEWGKNIITSAPLFIVPIVGISATVAKLYVAKKFEDGLWKYIRDQAKFLEASASSASKRATTTTTDATTTVGVDSRSYDCDYIEGYPGWNKQIEGGKLVLFREKGGKNRLVFKSQDGRQIVIPAQNIAEATIISRKKGLHENDLMIQLHCKDENGKNIKPVLNLNDDIIRGVLAGINEIAGEDKGLRNLEQVHVSTDTKYCMNCGNQIQKEAKFCPSCGQKQ
ncbi:zinc ribbon domain-containing protein [Candidatus Nitrososphaera gargensis]|uniref:zinc ribbon domain-containing protein n=1 Tax=Candidatus Nitrososphaera gargensis TaxID=497727 RepID=UPI0011E581FC|nr:zinc ribbon domain-containing protein [Candidatus Nitrososphaera gargensis]